jgi:hypothetical protein
MQQPVVSKMSSMTFDQVIGRISKNTVVDGIFVIEPSDPDLRISGSDRVIVAVLSEMPVPLHVSLTFIEHKLTLVLFTLTSDIDSILSCDKKYLAWDYIVKIATWLKTGRIAFDRSGRLKLAQEAIKLDDLTQPFDENDQYEICFNINMNYHQNKHLLESTDPLRLAAFDLELIHSLTNLSCWYFYLRNIMWLGEKKALRYWEQHDPGYLSLIKQFHLEPERKRKFQVYEQLAALTIAPAGQIWNEQQTALLLRYDKKQLSGDNEKAYSFWEDFLSGILTSVSTEHLSLTDCADFIGFALSKVQTTGLLLILKEYGELHSEACGAAVGSWYQNIREGKSFRDAIVGMSPRFHLSIEHILIESMEKSCLDHALADMNDILKRTDSEEAIFEGMTRLVNKYTYSMDSEFICDGCFMRCLERIMRRAEVENAYEIIFEQDGERYFIQKFLGPMAVKYIEPCHSKVYSTLLSKFKELSSDGKPFELLGVQYTVRKRRDNTFTMERADSILAMTFN